MVIGAVIFTIIFSTIVANWTSIGTYTALRKNKYAFHSTTQILYTKLLVILLIDTLLGKLGLFGLEK